MKLSLSGRIPSWLSFGFLRRLISPPLVPMGGLEISDSHLKFFYVQKGKTIAAGLRLPPGIVQNGRVADEPSFSKALTAFRGEITSSGFTAKRVHAVLSISSEIAYLQMFTLPYLSGKDLESAAELNLEMTSPMPFSEVYADWEIIGETEAGESQLEIMGAFSEKSNIDKLLRLLRAAGFVAVAVESSIVSVARAVQEVSGIDMKHSTIILNASDIGMDFAEVRNNRVHFAYFVSWQSIYGNAKEITKEMFEETVVRYLRRVITYAASHSGESKPKVLIVSAALGENFDGIISKNFGVEVSHVSFGPFANLGAPWGVAMGAYRRGLLPRSDDSIVSLTNLSTREEFRRSQIVGFAVLWRNVFATFLIFLLTAFFSLELFITKIAKNLEGIPVVGLKTEEIAELKELQTKADAFNALLASLSGIGAETTSVHKHFEKILAIVPDNIQIKRLNFQSATTPVLISGEGTSEQAVIAFKNILAGAAGVIGVDLPLNSIGQIAENRFSFSMTVSLAPLNAE